ncbi:MAG: cupin domain-containing protein [Chitinophagaceae bacterium]|nr:cupin domain-containing protein [Chitinophagaceae bacterium]
MKSEQSNLLFPKGEKLPEQWFTGNAYLQPLLARDKNNDFTIGSVSFEENARTHWHTHPKGQVLIVTEGEGLYQEKGKPAQTIKKADIINIPENTAHWHGATNRSGMTHIAISHYLGDTQVTWLNAVSNEEFNKANQ